MSGKHNRMRLIRAGIDTYQQAVVYMHRDCTVCRAEGFTSLTRISIRTADRELIAILNVVIDDRLPLDVASLSEAAWAALDPGPNGWATFSHPEPAASVQSLRAKVFGQALSEADFLGLMRDTVNNRLSDIELAAFVTACAGDRLSQQETTHLTHAMVAVGHRIDWGRDLVLDKHCVGGLPGNRTTPIVVAIVAAAGLRIPKTSSRAITSPAGTADTMEVMTPVALDLAAMRRVVERENGCIIWGGKVRLSPADDVLIRVERPLDFDSDGQLVASVLSKKVAAGSTHVLIDMPVGPTAKVRSDSAADALEARLQGTADAVGIALSVHRSDGRQPVGYGIGPALEARDVLDVLRNHKNAPSDLRERALDLAGVLLDIADPAQAPSGRSKAKNLLERGAALSKFLAICEAQGGFQEPTMAARKQPILATRAGYLNDIDNRRLAKVAKLAGAPASAGSGIDFRLRLGDAVQRDEPLFHIHAETPGELEYAIDYAMAHSDILSIGDTP